MMNAFTALEGAAIIAAHSSLTKILLSFSLRTYQFLESNSQRRAKVEGNYNLKQFEKAQMNESEYSGLLVAVLLFLHSSGTQATWASTLSVYGQVGYVWTRTIIGYPKLPTIAFAIIRYGGLASACWELWKIAYP